MPQTYQPTGDEFTVNGATSGNQVRARVTYLTGGGSIVVWSNSSGDFDSWGQRYDAAGNPVGSQFLLSLSDAGSHNLPKVTGLAGGGFLATWFNGQIHGQVFDSTGARVGAELTLNPTAPPQSVHGLRHYEISATDSGGFLVAWDFEFVGIMWREYDAAGTQIGVEHSIITATTAALDPDAPNVVQLAGGGYAVAYSETRHQSPPEGTWEGYLIVNTYDNAWNLLASDKVQTTLTVGHPQIQIDMVALEGGGSVVVSEFGLAQIYNAAGAQTGEIALAGASNLAVAALPDGGFAVVSRNGELYFEIFDASGNLVQGPIVVNNLTANTQAAPDIAVDADGDITLVWESQLGSGTLSYEIEARRYALVTTTPVDGTSGSDSIDGTEGNDTLNGLGGDDFLFGYGGNDSLNGGEGRDVLYSGPVNDGGDTLAGGNGDDFLFVGRFDIVVEGVGGGYDNVLASDDYVLTAGAYVEVLSTDNHGGTASIDLTGNELANILIGNAGNNRLDGNGGADRFAGLGGDDTYIIDSSDDVIDSSPGQGNDTLFSKVDYVLAAGVSIFAMRVFSGTDPIDLYGNELRQELYGNAGSNLLDSGATGETDTLFGSPGDDFYIVKTGDTVIEEFGNGGYDNVCARSDFTLWNGGGAVIEVLSTANHGGTESIDLTGNALPQVIIGNAGDNVLDGKGGNDRLDGFGGADSFSFTTTLSFNNVPVIAGFSSADDTILLWTGIFTNIGPVGPLPPGAFAVGTAATQADDRIIYDAATGKLYYDSDGNGAAAKVLFATLEGAPIITASDFAMT